MIQYLPLKPPSKNFELEWGEEAKWVIAILFVALVLIVIIITLYCANINEGMCETFHCFATGNYYNCR